MTWDYPESNPFAGGVSFNSFGEIIAKSIENLPASSIGKVVISPCQSIAKTVGEQVIISTDPPYYDNIGYADLSDFFYQWLRQPLKSIFTKALGSVASPKSSELVATPYRHGGKKNAEVFFLDGMIEAMRELSSISHPAFPITIYYAFKQSEKKKGGGVASTGWEIFLGAIIESGLCITGTWPMRTEREARSIGIGTNALASSVVLVCEKKSVLSINITRNDFRRKLRETLPKALKELERANIAPVDVAQAAIGPGMAIYTRAKSVLNPDDSPMSVGEALIEINAALDEYLTQDEGDLDADSRFALTFFESYGYEERDFGDAEGLAKARNLSVAGVAEAGILRSVAGKAWLLRREQLEDDWDPLKDNRLCVWEATQHLIRTLETGGEAAAAALLNQLKQVSGHGDLAANCRALAYRLYNHCEKKKEAEEARAYNGLVIAWPDLERQAAATANSLTDPLQTTLI
jgi:putative DNA methylase